MENSKYLSVGALTRYIKYKFDQDPYLTRVFLKGELSNVKRHTSGHIFFAVKDGNSIIRAVMFSRNTSGLNFSPEEGQSVLIEGRISIFESSGQYQIYVDKMEIDGIGAMFEKLEKDKKELREKGYFDSSHKKPLPRYPKEITIVSSETGAALRDMLTTLKRRYPIVKINIINTLMQGTKSRQAVMDSLAHADSLDSDIVILARGGGSIEDLWTFNEKEVALKVFGMTTPVITGVGHETDTTLVDYISDVRAATPTAAAEMAVPNRDDLLERLGQVHNYMTQKLVRSMEVSRKHLDSLGSYYKLKNPELLYDQQTEKLANLKDAMDGRMDILLKDRHYLLSHAKEGIRHRSPEPEIRRGMEILADRRQAADRSMKVRTDSAARQLSGMLERLNSLSPTNVLMRGYSFTTHQGRIVKDAGDMKPGDEIETTFGQGSVRSKVTEVREHGRSQDGNV